MIILKQLEKKNKSIQIFPFVMKDDYLIVVLTIFRMVKDTKKEIKESFSHIDNHLCINYDITYR